MVSCGPKRYTKEKKAKQDLSSLPPYIIRSGKSKVWWKNTLDGSFIHKDNLYRYLTA